MAWHASEPSNVINLPLYSLIVVLGVLSMGFQLLASRLLGPHFGSSIIVWAWLISTFLAAFSTGSVLGGWVSGLPKAKRLRTQVVFAAFGVAALALTAFFGRSILGQIEVAIGSISGGLFVACVGLFFVPVAVLSSFGPQCVQFLSGRGQEAGSASGIVYGVSTVGNIAGVMLTAFVFIPHFRLSTLYLTWLILGGLGMGCLIAILQNGDGEEDL